jgi:hypothetical protein
MKILLNYEQTARALQCSPRNARRILNKHKIKTIRLGHRTVRIPAENVAGLVITLAMKGAL